jgi:hypothetical protein
MYYAYIINTFVRWKEIKNITLVNNIIMDLRFGTLHVDLLRFYIEFYNFSTNMETSFIIVILDPIKTITSILIPTPLNIVVILLNITTSHTFCYRHYVLHREGDLM